MDTVDTQVHLNSLGSLDVGVAAMNAVGVAAVLFDDFSGTNDAQGRPLPGYALPNGAFRPLSPDAEAAALRSPDRFGILRRVDYRDPDLESIVKLMAAAPYVSVLRTIVFDAFSAADHLDAFSKDGFGPLFRIAAHYDLPLVVMVPGRMDLLRPYVEKYSSVRIVIDHCGAAQQQGGPADTLEPVLELARYRNVFLKWSHAPLFFATSPYPFPNVVVLLKRALSAFGPERVMWGSDFTVTAKFASWAEKLFYIRDAADLSPSDKEWVLGRTARTVFRWPLKEKTAA